MTYYTHNAKNTTNGECTFVKFIRADATKEALGLGAEWVAVDADEAKGWEELTGVDYPEAIGFDRLSTAYMGSARCTKYGRL